MENKEQPAHPQPIFQCRITAMSNGSVSVAGFPSNLNAAMEIMSAATRAIAAHFITEAKAGNLDDDNTII